MKRILATIFLLAVPLSAAMAQQPWQAAASDFMPAFREDFSSSTSEHMYYGSQVGMYFPGTRSLSEKDTRVMAMRINPATPAGAGRGPEIGTRKRTHFGSYSARIRVPDVKDVQPDVGAVTGYFTYRMDRTYGLSEIDFEWLIADPSIIYIGTWTGPENALQRIGRTINLATGRIYSTIYRSPADGNRNHSFSGEGNQPESIPAIAGYDASKRFHVYGFDWYPDRLTWWMQHPETGEKVVLWDYRGSTPTFTGIPEPPTTYLLNFWHTSDWPVETNPRSTEAPAYPYALEVDWMSYEPYTDLSEAWLKEHNYQ